MEDFWTGDRRGVGGNLALINRFDQPWSLQSVYLNRSTYDLMR